MGSVATPPPVAPVTAPVVTPPAPVAHPDAFRSAEDAIAAKFADRLAARAAIPAAPTEQAQSAPAVATPATQEAPPPEPVTETEVSLEDIDFDAPKEAAPAEAPKEIPTDRRLSHPYLRCSLRASFQTRSKRHSSASRGKQMLSSFKTLRELAKPPRRAALAGSHPR